MGYSKNYNVLGVCLYDSKYPRKYKSTESTKFTKTCCVNCAKSTTPATSPRIHSSGTALNTNLCLRGLAGPQLTAPPIQLTAQPHSPVRAAALTRLRCCAGRPRRRAHASSARNSASNSSPVIFSLSMSRSADLWSTSSCATMISFALV